MIKAILKACHIENAVTVETRHTPPVVLTHMCLSGPTGKQMVKHLIGEPPACYLLGLHDWADVPVKAKTIEGHPLHQYMGMTPISPALWTGDDGAPLTLEQRRELAESRGPWGLWINARGYAHCNGIGRSGALFVGLACEPALLSVFSEAACAYRSDVDAWGSVAAEYKLDDGKPRVDLDEAVRWTHLPQAT